jgi:DEAD/DEAH box helicase domain-containing protein
LEGIYLIIKYYDTEVKKSPEIVGWKNYKDMGMSVGVVILREYNDLTQPPITNETTSFEDPIKLTNYLNKGGVPVGFNNKSFDQNLLCEFAGGDQDFILKEFDMLENIDQEYGYRYTTNLDDLAATTIGTGKNGDGAHAPELYQKGKIKELTDYCINDVEITADVFEFGLKYGYVLIRPYKNKDMFGNVVVKLPVYWKEIMKNAYK